MNVNKMRRTGQGDAEVVECLLCNCLQVLVLQVAISSIRFDLAQD